MKCLVPFSPIVLYKKYINIIVIYDLYKVIGDRVVFGTFES